MFLLFVIFTVQIFACVRTDGNGESTRQFNGVNNNRYYFNRDSNYYRYDPVKNPYVNYYGNKYPNNYRVEQNKKQYYYPYQYQRPHYNPNAQYYRPLPNGPPYYRPNVPDRQSLIDILHSVAQHDDLQCVPRIICEMISDYGSGGQTNIKLPFNVDMSSLVGLLSFVNGANTSPILYFTKAALLGVASRKDRNSCYSSYPRCPQDPDQLVKYLNNHNGGFFRYFNGQSVPQFRDGNQDNQIQKRIQNKPAIYTDNFIRNDYRDRYYNPVYYNDGTRQGTRNIKFEDSTQKYIPVHDFIDYYPVQESNSIQFSSGKRGRDLKEPGGKILFPADDYSEKYNGGGGNNGFFPNHLRPVEPIYPDRTGTGNLRFNNEELY